MKISTKGRYGTRAMLSMACEYGGRLVRAGEIAEEQKISLKYLENILATLRAAGLIVSERGKNGGYALAKAPSEITLHSVLSPLEGSMGFVHCTSDQPECDKVEDCKTHSVWAELKDATDSILKKTTLQDLLDRKPCAGIDVGTVESGDTED
jgi:Rrf2 family transcriptional regulator, cysteine metabolism repressor